MSRKEKILPSLRKAWDRKGPRSRKRVPYPPDYYPGGEYLNLEIGQMRYWLMGPQDGKRIVFVPGHGTPCPIFRDVARSLASRGFRVLLFDLYGRGYSESPPLPHNPLLFTTQLGMLMHQIGFGSANIVGLSLGGGITLMNEIAEIVIYQFKNHPGYLRSLTATLHDYPIVGQEEVYKIVGERQRRDGYKMMALWGTADDTVPYSGSQSLLKLIPDVELISLPDKDHNLVMTDATTITEHISRFLS